MNKLDYYLKFVNGLKKYVESYQVDIIEEAIQFFYKFNGKEFCVMFSGENVIGLIKRNDGSFYNKLEYKSGYNFFFPFDVDLDNFDYTSFLQQVDSQMSEWISQETSLMS